MELLPVQTSPSIISCLILLLLTARPSRALSAEIYFPTAIRVLPQRPSPTGPLMQNSNKGEIPIKIDKKRDMSAIASCPFSIYVHAGSPSPPAADLILSDDTT